MKKGTCLYRVAEVDPPFDAPYTWQVECVLIERASARQIKLQKSFSGFGGVVFKPEHVGRLFFETPLQAIQHFLLAERLRIESLDRQRREAERAIAWAISQPGVTV